MKRKRTDLAQICVSDTRQKGAAQTKSFRKLYWEPVSVGAQHFTCARQEPGGPVWNNSQEKAAAGKEKNY